MIRTSRAWLSAAALAGCATAPAPQPVPIAQAAAERHPGAYPARAEVLAFQQEGRKIAALVERDPNFGGFIFRSEPEPHAVVMFTGDAEARLRRYTRDPRFKAQSVDLTLAQLERMKDQTGERLSGLGLKCFMVDGDEEHNRVTVSTPEVEKVEWAIAEGRFKPPVKFRLEPGRCPEFR